jgi:hypothetical protein
MLQENSNAFCDAFLFFSYVYDVSVSSYTPFLPYKQKTLKAIFRVSFPIWQRSQPNLFGSVALRPSITASLPLSVGQNTKLSKVTSTKSITYFFYFSRETE